MPTKRVKVCEWTSQQQALAAFAGYTEKTQSAGHIRPLHWYVACRLVLEGGFAPEDVTPRPPFRIAASKRGGLHALHYDPSVSGGGEATILGGLKTKNVDVVVTRRGIGPVLAVSCKGTTGAFRNLTNRMEELIGDCTNLHISYPTLVLGYLHLLRANRQIGESFEVIQGDDTVGDDERAFEAALGEAAEVSDEPIQEDVVIEEVEKRLLTRNDMAFDDSGAVVSEIVRFSIAVGRLAGRSGIRDDLTRYESIALALISAEAGRVGEIDSTHPDATGPLAISQFFERLYTQYDERFVYSAPLLGPITRRLEWSPESPVFADIEADYAARIGVPIPPKARGARKSPG